MRRLLCVVAVVGCAEGREPVSFDLMFEGPGGCDGMQLHVPLERVWLQQPAELAWSWSPVASAWAHPGHDPAGDVTGEAIGPWDLAPCAGSTQLGSGTGYASDVGSGELILRGVATLVGERDGVRVDLVLDVDKPVTGIPLSDDLSDGDQAVLALDVDFVLRLLPTEDTDSDGVLTITDDGVASSFLYALTNPNAWSLRLESP